MSFHTHYDTLRVLPSATRVELAEAYRSFVTGLLDQNWPLRSAMRQQAELKEIEHATSAFAVLGHSERREKYDAELRRQGIICDLCGGSGGILGSFGLKEIACIACQGTGKSKDWLNAS